jgi:hypothetical protein
VLLLALMLRLKVYMPDQFKRLQDHRAPSNVTLEAMLADARLGCPVLLEWAATWVERFFVYETR